MKSTWSVQVVYEDAQARERAVEFCDRMVERFWAQFGFEVEWSSYGDFEDHKTLEALAAKAAEADILVFATDGRRELPWPVRIWIERWVNLRGEREGKLVGLCRGGTPQRIPAAFGYLRHAAHRAGMDFVTEVPESIADAMPESPEMVVNRAQHVTSVLDAILAQRSRLPVI